MRRNGTVRGMLSKDWKGLAEGVFDYNVRRHLSVLPPKQMQINITYRCNARCEMCNIWQMDTRGEMTMDQWRTTMQDPIFTTIERLTVAGGEPTLHPQILDLLTLFMKAMPRLRSLTLITNGFLPRRTVEQVETIARLCRDRDVNLSVSVSIDGLEEMHESVRHIPNAFAKTRDTLLALQGLQAEFGFWLGVGTVVYRKNLYNVRDVRDWCEAQGIPCTLQVVGFHESYVANTDQQDELDFTEEDRAYLLELLEELAADRSPGNVMSYYWRDLIQMYGNGASRSTPCPFAVDAFVLDSFGDVYYCLSERKIGNCLGEQSVSDLYCAPENLEFRRWMTSHSCLSCNSACFVHTGLKKDLKKLAWYMATGRLGPPGV